MKVKIKDDNKFTPVTFEIRFEKVEELQSFWHRMNLSATTVIEGTESESCALPKVDSSYDIWERLNEYMNAHSLKGVKNAD